MNLFSEIDVPSHCKRVYLLIQWYIFGLDYNFISRFWSSFYPWQPWNKNMWSWWCHYEKKCLGLKDSAVESSFSEKNIKGDLTKFVLTAPSLYNHSNIQSVYWTRGLLQSEHLSRNFCLLDVRLISLVDLQTLISRDSECWTMITWVIAVPGVSHQQCKSVKLTWLYHIL